MTLRDRLIFPDGDYPAGTPCETPCPDAAGALVEQCGAITRLCVQAGELRVVKIGDALRIVPARAVQLSVADSSEAA